jgi:hypothetical protein
VAKWPTSHGLGPVPVYDGIRFSPYVVAAVSYKCTFTRVRQRRTNCERFLYKPVDGIVDRTVCIVVLHYHSFQKSAASVTIKTYDYFFTNTAQPDFLILVENLSANVPLI